ncbi:MAG: sigma-54 dependent transcriptional regulator [Thermoanaerobaculia bacterium]
MSLIWIVEDDAVLRGNMTLELRDRGFGARSFPSAEEMAEAWADRASVRPDLLLLDVRLPGISGVELVRRLVDDGELPPTIVVSGEASISETVEALRLGVWDFLEKPFTRERLMHSVRNCLEHFRVQRELAELRSGSARHHGILGRSWSIRKVRDAIEKVGPTTARVLVTGESGTGKELVAAAIHNLSPRAAQPFVKINCAAIPRHLVESELFGHVRGAFTDARVTRAGLFEAAHRGTLFLDEIGDMDLDLQARLLRVLEDGRVRRIGEHAERLVDVRLIAATNQDLGTMVREGRFREDLFYRISTVPIAVPPLRDRTTDVPLLFRHFLDLACRENQRPPFDCNEEALDRLNGYHWPGNVRELRNLCERLSVFGTDPITVEQLPSTILNPAETGGAPILPPSTSPVIPLRDFKSRCEHDYLERVLLQTNWNLTRAAQLLGIQRTYLHQKLAALGLKRPE